MAWAKVELTCDTCGRQFWHQKECYSRRDADDYEAWAQSHITTCSECYLKAKRAAAEKRAAEAVDGVDFPDMAALTGSPKQIAWAEKIRAQTVGATIKWLAKKGKTLSEERLGKINSITDSSVWIDHRRNFTSSVTYFLEYLEYFC